MAQCQVCDGYGKLPVSGQVKIETETYLDVGRRVWPAWWCRACGGSGVEHCCDGDRAQPQKCADREPNEGCGRGGKSAVS